MTTGMTSTPTTVTAMVGDTARRGYGTAHRKRRESLLRRMVDGDLCPRCGQPMYRADAANLDAGHPVGDPVALNPRSRADHLEHRHCNRAKVGERPPAPTLAVTAPAHPTRDWFG